MYSIVIMRIFAKLHTASLCMYRMYVTIDKIIKLNLPQIEYALNRINNKGTEEKRTTGLGEKWALGCVNPSRLLTRAASSRNLASTLLPVSV